MKYLFILLLTFTLTSCKKSIENIQQDLVIKAMTDGKWKVSNFTVNGNNITSDFASYRFQYFSNKTVDAINNNVTERTGTWDGDATTMTTYANFTSAAHPLILINGSWKIDRNSWTYVEATQIVGTETRVMRLDKE